MASVTNEVYIDKKTWLNSFKTFAKIMLAVVFVFFYLISALFFLAPIFDAKIFNFFGIVRAEEACYEMQYKKSGQLSDLYNLILFEQEHSNKEKELEYITELMSDDEYDEFCTKLDVSSVYNTKNKSMYAYVGDVNAYLMNRKIKCLYGLTDKESAIQVEVLKSLKNGKITEYAFATYVDLLKNNKKTTKEDYKALLETFELNYADKDVAELLDLRIDQIEELLASSSVKGKVSEILLEFSLMKLSYAGYVVYNAIGEDDSKINEFKQLYESSAGRYANLIK